MNVCSFLSRYKMNKNSFLFEAIKIKGKNCPFSKKAKIAIYGLKSPVKYASLSR